METGVAGSLCYDPDADTLDIWIGDSSDEAQAEPITENLVSKRNRRGEVIGFEIITLGKLNSEDMRRLPEEARALLKESATRLSIVEHPHR